MRKILLALLCVLVMLTMGFVGCIPVSATSDTMSNDSNYIFLNSTKIQLNPLTTSTWIYDTSNCQSGFSGDRNGYDIYDMEYYSGGYHWMIDWTYQSGFEYKDSVSPNTMHTVKFYGNIGISITCTIATQWGGTPSDPWIHNEDIFSYTTPNHDVMYMLAEFAYYGSEIRFVNYFYYTQVSGYSTTISYYQAWWKLEFDIGGSTPQNVYYNGNQVQTTSRWSQSTSSSNWEEFELGSTSHYMETAGNENGISNKGSSGSVEQDWAALGSGPLSSYYDIGSDTGGNMGTSNPQIGAECLIVNNLLPGSLSPRSNLAYSWTNWAPSW